MSATPKQVAREIRTAMKNLDEAKFPPQDMQAFYEGKGEPTTWVVDGDGGQVRITLTAEWIGDKAK